VADRVGIFVAVAYSVYQLVGGGQEPVPGGGVPGGGGAGPHRRPCLPHMLSPGGHQVFPPPPALQLDNFKNAPVICEIEASCSVF